MTEPVHMAKLAATQRTRLFGRLNRKVDVVLSLDNRTKAWLTGYASMMHDVAPEARSAVVAGRDVLALVTTAADAGPALEALGPAAAIYRYGTFYFTLPPGAGPSPLTAPAHTSFEAALLAALNDALNDTGRVGVERSADGVLWALCQEKLGAERVVDITADIQALRAVKTEGEIGLIAAAARLVEAGFAEVTRRLRPGMTEHDLAAIMTEQMVRGGGVPRFVSVTSAERSALADAYPTARVIQPGDTIRIDAGCTVCGYWSDLARSFVLGAPDARQVATYAALLRGLEAMLAAARPGIRASALYQIGVETVRKAGIPGYQRQHCGHGIGLRSYDAPTIAPQDDTELQAGMCLCLETPYYLHGQDGMMVEDMIVITEDGYAPLNTLPRHLLVMPLPQAD